MVANVMLGDMLYLHSMSRKNLGQQMTCVPLWFFNFEWLFLLLSSDWGKECSHTYDNYIRKTSFLSMLLTLQPFWF